MLKYDVSVNRHKRLEAILFGRLSLYVVDVVLVWVDCIKVGYVSYLYCVSH